MQRILPLCLLVFVSTMNAQQINPDTLAWATCGFCPEAPEVVAAGRIVTVGIEGREENVLQNNSLHIASAVLPPAAFYTIRFRFNLVTWDSYNPVATLNAPYNGGTGFWDSFSVSVSTQPYWQLTLTDPLTTAQIPGVGFLWGGSSFGDGFQEATVDVGETTIIVPSNPNIPNYLNVGLDTATFPESNHNFPSWGTFTIVGIEGSSLEPKVRGHITFNGTTPTPLRNVVVVHLGGNGVFKEKTITNPNGDYFFSDFPQNEYIVPVSSGTMPVISGPMSQSGNTNPVAQAYIFSPEVCRNKVRDTNFNFTECVVNSKLLNHDFAASSKPEPQNPPIATVFKLPLAGGQNWRLSVESGGYAIVRDDRGIFRVDADQYHTDAGSGWFALDFPSSCGTPILAPADGEVVVAETENRGVGWGRTVVLYHAAINIYTRYAHLDSIPKEVVKLKREGGRLEQGKVLGYMGDTGNSGGVHLHFQFYSSLGTQGSQHDNSQLQAIRIETGAGSLGLSQFLAGRSYQSTNTPGATASICHGN